MPKQKRPKVPKLFLVRETEPGAWQSRRVLGMGLYARHRAKEEGYREVRIGELRELLPRHAEEYEKEPNTLWIADLPECSEVSP